MHATETPRREFEISANDFEQVFSFTVEGDLTKVVTVMRTGKAFKIIIQYADIAIFEETRETFEANGPVTITETDSGIYLTSYRSLLSDRIRLRRTRFF